MKKVGQGIFTQLRPGSRFSDSAWSCYEQCFLLPRLLPSKHRPGGRVFQKQLHLRGSTSPSLQVRARDRTVVTRGPRPHASPCIPCYLVAVFELVNVPAQKSGDVTQLTDKTIGKKVFRIRGEPGLCELGFKRRDD